MVKELRDLSDFNQAIKDAGSRILCVMFHNGCRDEQEDWDAMKNTHGARVHMVKVNTLTADDVKNKYADGSAKPFFKAYRDGSMVEEIKYDDWGVNKGRVEQWLTRAAAAGGSGYNPDDGKVLELKAISDFNSAISVSGGRVMAVCFHNGCDAEEADYDTMKARYPGVCLYKVNTLNSDDIKKKYADGAAKPYFRAFRGGNLLDEIKYDSWDNNKARVEDWLARHSGGGVYDPNDGKVLELKTLEDFDNAIAASAAKVMAVCFHNGCREEESDYASMKARYPGVCLFKVNTVHSEEIKSKYADGAAKPYFKAYRGGNFLGEV